MRANGSDRLSIAAGALGAAIHARRRQLEMTQEQVAELADVGPNFLYQLEHGKPSVRLDKVLSVLQVLGLELVLRPGKSKGALDVDLEARDR